jgi:hypothetical protein
MNQFQSMRVLASGADSAERIQSSSIAITTSCLTGSSSTGRTTQTVAPLTGFKLAFLWAERDELYRKRTSHSMSLRLTDAERESIRWWRSHELSLAVEPGLTQCRRMLLDL